MHIREGNLALFSTSIFPLGTWCVNRPDRKAGISSLSMIAVCCVSSVGPASEVDLGFAALVAVTSGGWVAGSSDVIVWFVWVVTGC
jgi:hypothetical protein